MSLYKDKVDSFDKAFNKIVQDLDSDDDEPIIVESVGSTPQAQVIQLDQSIGEQSVMQMSSFDDYPYNLKLLRFGAYEQYETTWRTKLSDALRDLIAECQASGKVLVLTRKNEYEPLPLDGTPESLDLDSGTILNAIAVLPHQNQEQQGERPQETIQDPNVIHLKLQDGQRKHLKEFPINLKEPIGMLRKLYAQEFNHNLDEIKLCFDGDHCADEDTPESLELEDGYVLDVVIARS